MPSAADKRKMSLHLPGDAIDEMEREAARLDRSLSWVAQQAWKLAREQIKKTRTEAT